MFKKGESAAVKDIQGIHMKVLAHGKEGNMVQFNLVKGQSLPTHHHPYEQTGYVVSGKLELKIHADTMVLEGGDSYSIPKNKKHSAVALEDSVVIDHFTPLREEYL